MNIDVADSAVTEVLLAGEWHAVKVGTFQTGTWSVGHAPGFVFQTDAIEHGGGVWCTGPISAVQGLRSTEASVTEATAVLDQFPGAMV